MDAVPAAMVASTPTATVTWLAPLPSIVALGLPLAHTTFAPAHTTVDTTPTPTAKMKWKDQLPLALALAQAVDAMSAAVLVSMPTTVTCLAPPPSVGQT